MDSRKNQVQSQLLMQSKEQLQNQKYGNFTMPTVLSTAENLAWRLCANFPEYIKYIDLSLLER